MIDERKIAACHDEIRFTITDRAGSLRFTKFEIVGEDVCYGVKEALQSYLLNRSFADIDINAIRHVLAGGHEECVEAIADVIKWFRPTFKN